jgi:hypothetical protein
VSQSREIISSPVAVLRPLDHLKLFGLPPPPQHIPNNPLVLTLLVMNVFAAFITLMTLVVQLK